MYGRDGGIDHGWSMDWSVPVLRSWASHRNTIYPEHAMRLTTKMRLTWLAAGFLLGVVSCYVYMAFQLWPFEDNFLLKWGRWAGKQSIKWGFIALVTAVAIFVIVQVLNVVWFAREIKHKDDHHGS